MLTQHKEPYPATTGQTYKGQGTTVPPFFASPSSQSEGMGSMTRNPAPFQPGPAPQSLQRIGVLLGLCLILTIIGSLGINSFSQGATVAPVVTQPPPVLTVPTSVPTQHVLTATPVPSTPTPMPQKTPQPVAPPPSDILLAQDSFHRADQSTWGMASDGLYSWHTDATNPAVFSIKSQTGVVTGAGDESYNIVIGPRVADSSVVFTGMLNDFTNTNIGSVLRWQDTDNWYKAYIDGPNFGIRKSVNGNVTRMTSMPFDAQSGVLYSIRFRAVGHTLEARLWQADQGEPTTWMLSADDTTFSSGQDGLRVVLQKGAQATFKSYTEQSM